MHLKLSEKLIQFTKLRYYKALYFASFLVRDSRVWGVITWSGPVTAAPGQQADSMDKEETQRVALVPNAMGRNEYYSDDKTPPKFSLSLCLLSLLVCSSLVAAWLVLRQPQQLGQQGAAVGDTMEGPQSTSQETVAMAGITEAVENVEELQLLEEMSEAMETLSPVVAIVFSNRVF